MKIRIALIFTLMIIQQGIASAQTKLDSTFFDKTDTFLKENVNNNLVTYSKLKNNIALEALIISIGAIDLSEATDDEKKAFYINAYNLIVINSIVKEYPVESVKEVAGFFDGKKHVIAGKKMTLNNLEKKELIEKYKDPRFHFVLVCGAVGCPPITNFAYTPEKVKQQMETQTNKAMNNPEFLQIDNLAKKANLSEIFKWYASDFGGSKKNVLTFINKYKSTKIANDYSVGYYAYDWSLNASGNSTIIGDNVTTGGANASRYVVSAAIVKGTHELKLFNNLYTQSTGSEENNDGLRSTFFTSTFSYLYGLTGKFNLGAELRLRSVSNDPLPSSGFDVLKGGSNDNFSTRTGVSGLGPKIRWAPFEKLSHFSLQSTLLIPFEEDQEGTENEPFIDWNNATWTTQFFYDFDIGNSFSLFTEVDFSIEDIGKRENGAFNRYATPVTVIFSYFPTPKITLYALSNYGPQFNKDLATGWNYDYYYQVGAGAKYQITKKFELEVLYTLFRSKFLLSADQGKASTINLGIRKSF